MRNYPRSIFLYLCVTFILPSCTHNNQKTDSNLSYLGGRSVESVRQVFEAEKHRSFSIYKQYLQNDPDFGGELSFRVSIKPSGKVYNAEIVTNTTESNMFAKQVLSLIYGLEFNDENVGDAVIFYKYIYSPK